MMWKLNIIIFCRELYIGSKKNTVPPDAKIITSTRDMKKKSDGNHRARLNTRIFEQEDDVHYTKDDVSEPVVNEITIRIVFILMINDAWWEEFLDVKREFLTGIFDKVEELYTEVPQGMKKYYPLNIMLLPLRKLYGPIQAAT